MKLISSQQRARVRLRFEITAAAVMATLLLTLVIATNTPGYTAALRQILAA